MAGELETYAIAREAKFTADRALDLAKAASAHLTTISGQISSLAAENTAQHRENSRIVSDGLEKVHSRISDVKKNQDENRLAYTERFGELALAIANTKAHSDGEVAKVREQSKDGAAALRSDVSNKAIKVMWTLMALMLVTIAALIGYITHGQLTFNP